MAPTVHILLDIFIAGVVIGSRTYTTTDDLHIWDGLGTLSFTRAGESSPTTYTGVGYTLDVGASESKTGIPDRRLNVSLGIGNDNSTVKTTLSQDLGPLRAEMNFILSADGQTNWSALPIKRKGRLSNMQFDVTTGKLSAEMETPRGDILRGSPRYWSHETQQQRFPNDMGLEFLSIMQTGFETSFPYGFIPELSINASGSGGASSPSAHPTFDGRGGFVPPA